MCRSCEEVLVEVEWTIMHAMMRVLVEHTGQDSGFRSLGSSSRGLEIGIETREYS